MICRKKRMVARTYSLETGETKSIVCKNCFRATLDIGEAYINHALSGKSESHFQGIDNRGRHTPANKTPENKMKKYRKILNHSKFIIIRLLCRFAAVPAHEAYKAHTAHPVLCTHFGFKKGIWAVSCPYPTPICVK